MNKSFSLKHVFFWLSGAGSETLEACPNWEQRKYVAFGATVLVPCLFAFIACAYALSTVTNNYAVVFPVALVWAFIILTIDRALIVSYRPYLSFLRKVGQFTVRICVAILMGITIAHPLVLLLFRDTIASVIEKDRQVEAAQIRTQFTAEKTVAEQKIAGVEKAIADLREAWNNTFQASFIHKEVIDPSPMAGLTLDQQTELKKAIEAATAPAHDRLDVIQKQVAELTPTYTKLQAELAFWQSEFERELNGQRSGIVGLGPRAHSIQDDQIPWRRAEVARQGALLQHYTEETTALQSQARKAEADAIAAYQATLAEAAVKQKAEADRVTALRQKVESDQATQFVGQQNQLRDTLKSQIDAQIGDLKLAQAEVTHLADAEQAQLASLMAEPRRDLLTQSLALHRLFKAGDQGGQFALGTYLILVLLFMLVDTVPLMIKFVCKAGPYDNLLDRDEVRFESDHRAFITSHGRYMNELSAGNLMAVTRNKPLEDALVDGVEHTRAAREFLNSLIDMEKAFNERLQLEEAAAQGAAPEKLAALEMMKKRFYDGLHQRMEAFFDVAPKPSNI
jgi:hypothetical protein